MSKLRELILLLGQGNPLPPGVAKGIKSESSGE
jgi:hypothetical protein